MCRLQFLVCSFSSIFVTPITLLLMHYCSLSKLSAPLESVIRDKLLAKQPGAYDWFWSEHIPAAVTSFVNYFEKEQRFAPATAVYAIISFPCDVAYADINTHIYSSAR